MHVTAAVWGGAKLADVLELVGIPKCSRVTPSGEKHVEFVSIDKCKVNYLPLMLLIIFFSVFKRKACQLTSTIIIIGRKWRPLQSINSINSSHKPRV